jgi:small subunit ribosomal protein S21
MIKIPVKEGESIERALKRLKRKTDRTGVIKEVRTRKQYIKPSVKKRQQLIKAKYVEQLKREENE